MPIPTMNQLKIIYHEALNFAARSEEMKDYAKTSTGELAAAYLTIANDYEFKLCNAINKLWLYVNNSTTEL